ncbi:MAG: hemolysin family protein [Planctomycetota bacterium]
MTASLWLLGVLVALLVGATCTAVLLALQDVSRGRLEELMRERRGEAGSRRAQRILEDISGHQSAIALLRVPANLSVAICAVMWVAAFRGVLTPGWIDAAWGLGGATLLVWLFGLVIPLSIADHAGERSIQAFALPLRAAHLATAPFRAVARLCDESVRRLAGAGEADPDEVLERDLLDVVEEHTEGEIDDDARDMLEAVVEFRTTTVEQVMTPRTEINALEYTDDLAEVTRRVNEMGHSRMPVYADSLDQIRGILYAKDLLRWITRNDKHHANNGAAHHAVFSLADILRDATFVPEAKTVRELLRELLAARVHIAMVADEYGGTSGLVTIEDIVEEIFGEIQDEYEAPEPETAGVTLGEGEAEVEARTEIDAANDALESIGIELPESADYDTVAGWINASLGRIPGAGERVEIADFAVEVLEAEPTRVVRVRLRPAEPAPEPDAPAK